MTIAAGRIFSIYHLPLSLPLCLSLPRGERALEPRSDSRNAADTVGVNGIYVPVECILIIRVGVFEAAIQCARVREIFTLRGFASVSLIFLSISLSLSDFSLFLRRSSFLFLINEKSVVSLSALHVLPAL